MSDAPDFIVIRAHPDLPAGFLPPDMEGKWVDRSTIPTRPRPGLEPPLPPHLRPSGPDAVAVPTGRFETRGDGAVAEVWEVQP